ncbi:MAG: hypothetical protein ACXVEA_11155, partial [Actinomycetota bacterium]
ARLHRRGSQAQEVSLLGRLRTTGTFSVWECAFGIYLTFEAIQERGASVTGQLTAVMCAVYSAGSGRDRT